MEDNRTRLTEEYLVSKGFTKVGERGYSSIYRKKPENYHWGIEVSIGDYPEENGNCGIVAIHDEDHVESYWHRRKKKIQHRKASEASWGIAWNVWDTDRLERIYELLTNEQL